MSLKPWQRLTILSLLAGILYNTWPLGLLLNPYVAHHGLASELAGKGQPYNWLFTYGDVFSGIIMLIVAWRIWKHYHLTLSKWSLGLIIGGLITFSLAASAAALSPVQCISALKQCPNFTHNSLTLIHAITSVLAVVGLFFAIAGLLLKRWLDPIILPAAFVYFIVGWWALIVLFTPGQDVFVQNALITICAICLAAYPWGLERIAQHD